MPELNAPQRSTGHAPVLRWVLYAFDLVVLVAGGLFGAQLAAYSVLFGWPGVASLSWLPIGAWIVAVGCAVHGGLLAWRERRSPLRAVLTAGAALFVFVVLTVVLGVVSAWA